MYIISWVLAFFHIFPLTYSEFTLMKLSISRSTPFRPPRAPDLPCRGAPDAADEPTMGLSTNRWDRGVSNASFFIFFKGKTWLMLQQAAPTCRLNRSHHHGSRCPLSIPGISVSFGMVSVFFGWLGIWRLQAILR